MPTALVSSDWHGDWSTLGVSRFDEVERAVEQSVEVAIARAVDVYICLGDIADPDNGGATLRAQLLAVRTALSLQRKGIRSIWLRGNHDVCEDGSNECVLAPLKALEEAGMPVHVADHPCLIGSIPGIVFLCLPFMPASHGVDLATQVETNWPDEDGSKVIVLSHLSVPGAHVGSETSDMPRGREISYPFQETKRASMRLQGHYHRRQKFDPGDGGPPLIIPGSLARLTFGEEDHDPSFLIVDL